MEDIQKIRNCKNCLHCIADSNGEHSCAIGYDMKSAQCVAFAPKDLDVEVKHSKQVVGDLLSTPLTYFALSLFALVLVVCIISEFKVLGEYALYAIVAVGLIYLILAAVLRYIYRCRRKRMERSVRFEVEQKVRRSLLPKTISISVISDYLSENNYLPEFVQDGKYWTFTYREGLYALYYDSLCRMFIRYSLRLNHPQMASIIDGIIDPYKVKEFGVQMWIRENKLEDGQLEYALEVVSEFFAEDENEFKKWFPRYLGNINQAICRVEEAYQKEVEMLNRSDEEYRADIYGGEYRFVPILLKAISENRIAAEALTDEEYLRETIKEKCADEVVRAEWDSFVIKRVDNYGNYKMIVYKFPEPKFVPEAKYGVVLIDMATKKSSYYTLELSYDDMWYYGGVKDNTHENYGPAESADLDRFIEWVLSSNKPVHTSTNYGEN